MAVTFALKGFTVCACDTPGRHEWTARLTAINIDSGIVYDNADTGTNNPLLMRLAQYGDNLVIRHMSVQYIGAASGMVLQPTIYTSDDTFAFLESRQTGYATDKCAWPGLHVPVTFKKMYHYLFRMTVTGYASGSDDMTVTLHGEVF